MSTFFQNDPIAGKNMQKVRILQEFYAPVLANLTTPPEDTNGGALGYYNGGIYFWDGSSWAQAGGGISSNIYTQDGTLLSNRTVNGDGKDLTFSNINTFIVTAANAGLLCSGIVSVSGSQAALSAVGGNELIKVSSETSPGAGNAIAEFINIPIKANKYLNDASKSKFFRSTIDGTFELADPLSSKGQPNGLTPLGSDSKIPSQYIPALAITETFVVASQAAMLALAAQTGDVAVRTDTSETYILKQEPATTLANWVKLLNPAAPVQSVDGKTGNVDLSLDYIKNSTASQGANFNISGSGQIGTTITPLINSGASNGAINLLGGATGTSTARGAEIVLRGGVASSNPGVLTIHTGTGGGNTQQPERVRILANGNVGIGTPTAGSALELKNATAIAWNNSSNAAGDAGITVDASNKLHLLNAGQQLTVLDNGNVGIGTTSPTAKLEAAGVINASRGFLASGGLDFSVGSGITVFIDYQSATNRGRIGVFKWSDSSWMPLCINEGGGNVGIGTQTPGSTLEVNGVTRALGISIKTGTGNARAGLVSFPTNQTSVTVNTTAITANSMVFLTIQSFSATTPPAPWISNRTGNSFDINFDKPAATSGTIAWMIVEPY